MWCYTSSLLKYNRRKHTFTWNEITKLRCEWKVQYASVWFCKRINNCNETSMADNHCDLEIIRKLNWTCQSEEIPTTKILIPFFLHNRLSNKAFSTIKTLNFNSNSIANLNQITKTYEKNREITFHFIIHLFVNQKNQPRYKHQITETEYAKSPYDSINWVKKQHRKNQPTNQKFDRRTQIWREYSHSKRSQSDKMSLLKKIITCQGQRDSWLCWQRKRKGGENYEKAGNI